MSDVEEDGEEEKKETSVRDEGMDPKRWIKMHELLDCHFQGLWELSQIILGFLPSYIIFRHFLSPKSVFSWTIKATTAENHSQENCFLFYENQIDQHFRNPVLHAVVMRKTEEQSAPHFIASAVLSNIKCILTINPKEDTLRIKIIDNNFEFYCRGYGPIAADSLLPECPFTLTEMATAIHSKHWMVQGEKITDEMKSRLPIRFPGLSSQNTVQEVKTSICRQICFLSMPEAIGDCLQSNDSFLRTRYIPWMFRMECKGKCCS